MDNFLMDNSFQIVSSTLYRSDFENLMLPIISSCGLQHYQLSIKKLSIQER
jgi:hypothetical protein